MLAAPAAAKPHPGASGRYHRAVCAPGPVRTAHCLADVVTDAKGTPVATAATVPAGYGPTDLQNAYNLASAIAAGGGSGKTVAIVDAYHDPNAAADLGVYRSTYNLPPCGSGCFQQLNESGGTSSYPSTNASWAQEISLDLDMVSAICPSCHIMLVEANSAYMSDLGTAVNTAASLGASAISNSYGGSEYSSETNDDSYYNHPNVNVTVSSGDNGYGVEFPAASPYVTAVGGTSLTTTSANTRGWSETAWSGAGSGCSAYESRPSWQQGVPAGCSNRAVADESAVADPNTGVAVYDSLSYAGQSGWMVFGGTSVASPVVASVDALSSTTRSLGFAYANPSQFFDVVGGSNGSCSVNWECHGVTGYDGPTGIGSPNGAGTVAPPTSPPQNTTPPAITGSTAVGQTLTASTGAWTNSPTSFSYQWQRCSTSCANIPSATGSNYTLQSGDVGNKIDVVVTATNGAGPSAPATSSSVGPVAAGQADFTITAPGTASLRRSSSTNVPVTVGSVNGYNSQTTMSVSGLPRGVSPTWTANPTYPGTTTLTLKATWKAVTGTFSVTITGASGTLTHSTVTQLTVS